MLRIGISCFAGHGGSGVVAAELGKQLAGRILPELHADAQVSGHDASTNALINYYRRMNPPRTGL